MSESNTAVNTSDEIITVRHLSKSFGTHEVLKDIDFAVRPGDVASIIGASGSGKSTLLRCINLLETPTSGEILYHGTNILDHSMKKAKYRSKVGMVFQSFNLFNNMTVLKNCMIGQMKVLGRSREESREKALEYLDKVGMSPFLNAKPRQLSGGQKQRVAIARAMANDPDIILADEPTGALDTATGHMVMDLFHRLHREQGKTIVLITHNPELAQQTQRIFTMVDGVLGEGVPTSGGAQ